MDSRKFIEGHPCKERIKRLLSGDFDPNNSNCFGTTLYLIGVNNKPRFIPRSEMEDFLNSCSRPDFPAKSPVTIMCSQVFPNSYPTHAAVYLGENGGRYVVVEQPGTKIPYAIREFEQDDWLLGPHFYHPNP